MSRSSTAVPVPTEIAAGDKRHHVAINKPYNVFTHKEKWLITILASCAAVFSPFTANIYFPAIPVISTDFHKSIELINLTVTMYMVMQGYPQDLQAPLPSGWLLWAVWYRALVAPCLGPIVGGLWLRGLAGGPFSGSCASALPLLSKGFSRILPETLRAIVGDGSIPAGRIYTQPISLIGRHRSAEISSERPARQPFKNPLLMFAYPEIFVLLIFNGTLYAVMYGVTASLTIIFEKVYPYLNEAEIGLCFIPMGLGLLVGSLFSGRAMDSYYRKIKDDLIRQTRTDSKKYVDLEAIEKDPSFPIEKARLQILPWVLWLGTPMESHCCGSPDLAIHQ
ncbi:hypothetical protein BGY98DRAFT_930456 [Russula aff. rugulosa BPL654]|nr:hypothetical protein BGY98DRAFT_930456 [Russula aff. rugulosa BPL654]